MSGPVVEVQDASGGGGGPDAADVETWVAAALDGRRDGGEMTVRIVDEDEGRRLNRDYRGYDRATNVLAFPFESPPGIEPLPYLGDLVLCAPVVAREAREQGKAVRAHWAHLVVHGTLHLLGYDHIDEEEAVRMEAEECRILARLGVPDPYADEPGGGHG